MWSAKNTSRPNLVTMTPSLFFSSLAKKDTKKKNRKSNPLSPFFLRVASSKLDWLQNKKSDILSNIVFQQSVKAKTESDVARFSSRRVWWLLFFSKSSDNDIDRIVIAFLVLWPPFFRVVWVFFSETKLSRLNNWNKKLTYSPYQYELRYQDVFDTR